MLWWFVQNALIAVVLAAIVWPVCRIRRVGPAVRHALWLVVLLKLVTPPLVTWPWSAPIFFEWLRPASMGRAIESVSRHEMEGGIASSDVSPYAESGTMILHGLIDESTSPSVQPQFEEADGAGLPAEAIKGESATFGVSPKTDSVVPEQFGPSGSQGIVTADGRIALAAGWIVSPLGACWMLGTAVSILIHAIQVVRFFRLVARCEQPSQSLLRQMKNVAATLRVRPPRVVVVAGIRSPVIWGGMRAQLVWPACLPPDFESGRWDGVIAHELAHLRRRDHWVGWLELLAGCVWWWNPLFWYVRHQLRENAELACDALVVWALPDGRRTYAESLIEVVSHFSPVATPAPVLGVNSVARQAFERRLTMILSERVPWKLSVRGLLAIGLLAMVALPGWSLGQVPARTPDSAAAAPVNQKPAVDPTATPSPDVKGEIPVSPALNADPKNVFEFFVGAFDSAPAQSPGSDQRMDALEKKLEALIADVKAIRATRNAPARPIPMATLRSDNDSLTRHWGPLRDQLQRMDQAELGRVLTNAEEATKTLREHIARYGGKVGVGPAKAPPNRVIDAISETALALQAIGKTEEAAKLASAAQDLREQLLKQAAGSKEPFVQGVETAELKIVSRARYKLPKAKAEALAAFLSEHMKSPVEVKVDDDSLTVTASPEEQATIGQFIALSEGKQPPASATRPKTPQADDTLYHRIYPAPQSKPAAPASTSAPAKPAGSNSTLPAKF
ncbi:MAG: M56 family metallopeptidase [Planctomycetes bacterium]|nr:M56 family metallopeptidase [Planctomycetota bacterium]